MLKLQGIRSAGLASIFSCILGLSQNTCWARPEIARLTPSDPNVVNFGLAVGISGDYVVVGAPNGPKVDVRGAIVIFKFDGTDWVEQQTIFGPDFGILGDAFGRSVAISGDRIAVGAPFCSGFCGPAGFVRIYRREGETWVEEAEFQSSGSHSSDQFGRAVSLSNDLLAVGARTELGGGAAYVFKRENTNWVEEARVVPGDLAEEDGYGVSVSLRADLLAAGSYLDDDGGQESGSVYVFRRVGMAWTQEAKLTASDATAADRFGGSVSIGSSMSLVIGARGNDDVGTNSGAVYAFELEGAGWVEDVKLTATDAASSDEFGRRVEMDGNTLLASSAHDDGEGNPGIIYLFKRPNVLWLEIDKLETSDPTFGGLNAAMCAEGSLAAVGGQDAVYVFSTAEDIPAVGAWGMVVMLLAIITAGTLALRRGTAITNVHP